MDFRNNRLPKFMGWFDTVLQRNPRNAGRGMPHLVGGRLSYADLSLFQLVEGLLYALPYFLFLRTVSDDERSSVA